MAVRVLFILANIEIELGITDNKHGENSRKKVQLEDLTL